MYLAILVLNSELFNLLTSLVMKTIPDDINDYWTERKGHDLYRLTKCLALSLFSHAESVIDVGCFTSGLICELDWIPRRVATDIDSSIIENWKGVQGVEFIAGDAFLINFKEPFDLVICNQTIEHLDDPHLFCAKLLQLGRALIISTTYEVSHGLIPGHVQDPISLSKFKSFFGCNIDAYCICHHPHNKEIKHIIGVIRQSHPNRQ